MKKTKAEIIEYIKNLEGYEGYVQFSHRRMSEKKDIFLNNDENKKVEDEEGFILEAHFYKEKEKEEKKEKESIQIRQINSGWLVSKTDLTDKRDERDERDERDKRYDISYEIYLSDIKDFNYKIKMAQIWEKEKDPLCEGMEVKKLKKVVFAGFEKGESK